jgi:hypothetical protein
MPCRGLVDESLDPSPLLLPCQYDDEHCTKNPIYLFPKVKLHGPNSYIHVSASDLYVPRIGLPMWLQQKRQTDPGNI